MSAPVPSTRRLAVAIGTAATAATVAIGVTAASLLGWFSPTSRSIPASETTAPAPTPAAPVILVPVAPADDVQLAMIGDRAPHEDDDDDDDRRESGRDHDGDHDEHDEESDDD
jgi:hypothetical protein